MTWRDELRRVTLPDGRRLIGASFRGIPFFVEDVERRGGRRLVDHEFPRRDANWVDDMGRRARRFPITGYVIGDDYLRHRDDLISALEDYDQPGELTHPYYGTLRAACDSYSVYESTRDGGMARVSIEFVEAPDQPTSPSVESDLGAAVELAATAAGAAVLEELERSYSVDGQPGFALESLSGTLTTLSATLAEALAPLTTTTQELARLSQGIQILTAQASSLVRDPGEALAAFAGVLGAVTDSAAAAPYGVFRALLDTYGGFTVTTVFGDTATRELERANQTALSSALLDTVLIEAAILIPRVDFDSLEQATESRDELAELLDAQATEAGDLSYPALIDLRSAVVRAVPGDAVLARILARSQRDPLPALVLSYQLYGSIEGEEDIIARNGVRHPGFVGGDLEVLSDV